MAGTDDSSNPQTLANLWLKPRPARAASQSAPPTERDAPRSEAQLGLLFAAASDRPIPAKPERRIWSVGALVTDVRQHVESSYADVWVQGEISNCRPAPSGHIYFTLKDGEAQLSVVLFRLQAQLLRFRPQDGLAVLIRGRISVYESRGQLQLIADTMEPRGAGALQLAFDQLKARLLAEGLFDFARKCPLPAFPRTVGVITSTGGAVLHDIIKVIRRRHSRLNLLVYPALMQGPECAAQVAAGIRFFNQPAPRAPSSGKRTKPHPSAQHPTAQPDIILIARGGGSLEDLAGFNDEALARAIASSTLPIVSAIGHETDFTIADFVADLRAPTPSAAAELITAAQHRIAERIQALDARVYRAARYQLILARQRLTASSIAHVQSRIQTFVGRRGQRLDDLQRRLESSAARRMRTRAAQLATLSTRLHAHDPTLRLAAARRRFESANERLTRLASTGISARVTRVGHASARLEALSPLAVLKRGYALVYAADGQILRNAADAHPGQTIRARLAHGTLEAEVTATNTSPKPNYSRRYATKQPKAAC